MIVNLLRIIRHPGSASMRLCLAYAYTWRCIGRIHTHINLKQQKESFFFVIVRFLGYWEKSGKLFKTDRSETKPRCPRLPLLTWSRAGNIGRHDFCWLPPGNQSSSSFRTGPNGAWDSAHQKGSWGPPGRAQWVHARIRRKSGLQAPTSLKTGPINPNPPITWRANLAWHCGSSDATLGGERTCKSKGGGGGAGTMHCVVVSTKSTKSRTNSAVVHCLA